MNLLNASMLLDSKNVCIEDYYLQNSQFYYLQSNNNTWYSISIITRDTSNSVTEIGSFNASSIQHGFTYDSINNLCVPPVSDVLGVSFMQYNFLLGLCGLLFGGTFLYFMIEAFVRVGKK